MRFFSGVTIVAILSKIILINGCDEEMQIVEPVIVNGSGPLIENPETSEVAENPTTVGDLKKPETSEQSEESEAIAEMSQTVMLPDSIFIPSAETVLSKNEKDLADYFALTGRDPTEPNPLKPEANNPVDRISLLPLKDREEVYNALVAAVDLSFFAEAAEKMKSRNITFASLFIEAVKTKNWEKFNNFLENLDQEMGIHAGEIDEDILAGIYFEENPEDKPHAKQCSCYWMLLEYYRLQLQYPQLEISVTEDKKQILHLYRQSAQAGNILGLANPWN